MRRCGEEQGTRISAGATPGMDVRGLSRGGAMIAPAALEISDGGYAMRGLLRIVLLLLAAPAALAADPPRGRDLGIPFDGTPGPWNAITDVAGVTVGHRTLIEDLPDGRAVRTGVSGPARGRDSLMRPVFAGWFA
jgi:hypothetical protein